MFQIQTQLSGLGRVRDAMVDVAFRNLWLENPRKAVDGLGTRCCDRVELRYGRGLTMEEIGTICGVSKTAVSLGGFWWLCRLEPSFPPLRGKRLKKLHEQLRGLCQMTEPLDFLCFLVYKPPVSG